MRKGQHWQHIAQVSQSTMTVKMQAEESGLYVSEVCNAIECLVCVSD